MRTIALALILPALPLTAVHAQAAPCSATSWASECSTPGVQIALVEAMRQPARGDIVVGYHVTAHGVPAGRIYSVWLKPTAGEAYALITGFTPDSTGVVVCADSTALANRPRGQGMWCKWTLGDVGLTAGGFARGEAYRVGLISTDDSVRAFASVIPHALAATSGGCTVSGEMFSREVFAFTGSGFRPGEPLQVTSRSGGDTQAASRPADDAGRLPPQTIRHLERGKRGGDASIEIAGAGCRVMLRYGWGNKIQGPGS